MNEAESRWAVMATKAIEAEVGDNPDPEALSESAARLCRRLCGQLSLLVGVQGFRAILALALHLSQEDFPFLTGVQISEGCDALVGLLPRLQGQDAPTGRRAVVELLARTLDLLAGLIGAGLLHRYLAAAWPHIGGAAESPNPETADNGG